MIGVSPIIVCLLFIGLARLVLHRLEIAYYRRQKITNRRSSLVISQNGRLTLSYTPVSNAELQRIIQGEYKPRQANDSSSFSTSNNSITRKAPRFIKSILPRREPALSSTSILANLVLRRDAIDTKPIAEALAPAELPLQPMFSIINENKNRRPSVITITRESFETTTLAPMNSNNNNTNNGNFLNTNDIVESEQVSNDSLMTATKTMTTTTTVVVEEFLEFHSVNSLPYALTLPNSVSEIDNDIDSEINNDNDEE
jgi:hypothetical protein